MSSLAPTSSSLAQRAHAIRRTVIRMCMGRGQGYAGQGLALAELMAALSFRELRGPQDHVVLSTGHSAIALFAALHEQGVYELEELQSYGMDGSRIEESPLEGTPGFEITGGSLGQGLSQAVGLALGERLRGSGGRVYCLVSDGELQEGQTWEACMSAGHHRLDNLVLLVDNNRMQADGATAEVMAVEPVQAKLEAFGFAAREIDANDLDQVLAVLDEARATPGRPFGVVCDTLPGKGVPSFERYAKVHYIRAEQAVWERALEELGRMTGGNGLPIARPTKIVCVGLDYRLHADESAMQAPERPLLFAKWPSALVGPGDAIVLPRRIEQPDYEAELAVVLGRSVRNVSKENALEAVAGAICLNDVSARDVQLSDGQWTRGKSFDTFCPIGPRLVPLAELGDLQRLRVRCLLNGRVVQDASTADMIFPVDEIIAFASRDTLLEAGDVIATGTPSGVALGQKDPRWLEDGDVVTVEIEGLGQLTNPVRRAPG